MIRRLPQVVRLTVTLVAGVPVAGPAAAGSFVTFESGSDRVGIFRAASVPAPAACVPLP